MNDATNQIAELGKLQRSIAAGRPPALPEGKRELFVWHPTIKGFGMRLYANGTATWLLQYRNKRGLQHRMKLGQASGLDVKAATEAAYIALADIAKGIDPQADVNAAREKPKHTFNAMATQFLDIGKGSKGKPLGVNTLRQYRCVLDNYIGALGKMQIEDIIRKDVSERITFLERTVSPHIANHTKSFISSVFASGISRGVLECNNPAIGGYKSDIPESCARALSFEELGSIFRACEDLAADPVRYRGNALGGGVPVPANSDRHPDAMLTRKEAARATGVHPSILWNAYKAGELKAEGTRRALGIEDHPMKIGQGYHRNTLLFRWRDLQDYVSSRLGHMRSPAAEHAAIVRLLMLMGGRYSEMAALRWSEIVIDGDKWSLHIKGKETEGKRGTKNRKDLKLPIPHMAVDIIKQFPRRPDRDLIFGDGPTGLRNNSRLKSELDAHIAKFNGGKPIAAWRHHDLRHSISTLMNEAGIDSRVVETITAHSGGFGLNGERSIGHKAGIAGRYNHAEYRNPVTLALDWWSGAIRAAADGTAKPAANVHQLFKGIA